MKIDSYKFGRIIIDGVPYTSDVILHPDHVEGNWWRKEGHKLLVEDIEKAVERDKPEVLVVGTGKFGAMSIPEETKEYLQSKGIELIAAKTDKACQAYNQLYLKKRVLGAFHLTC